MFSNNDYNSTCATKIVASAECEKMPLVETAKRLYDNLAEIEAEITKLSTILFGQPKSEVCAGTPDCLDSNINMALNTAINIRTELVRIRDGLGC